MMGTTKLHTCAVFAFNHSWISAPQHIYKETRSTSILAFPHAPAHASDGFASQRSTKCTTTTKKTGNFQKHVDLMMALINVGLCVSQPFQEARGFQGSPGGVHSVDDSMIKND
jgi:hypothetical protein